VKKSVPPAPGVALPSAASTPRCMVLVKPATRDRMVSQGHWRRRSRRSGRSKTIAEIRDLIRRMSSADPFWGAPRIHSACSNSASISTKPQSGGICRGAPNPLPDLAQPSAQPLTDTLAIDMFIVATATFRTLYALIVLDQETDSTPLNPQDFLRSQRHAIFDQT
jgi:hypothetical protein